MGRSTVGRGGRIIALGEVFTDGFAVAVSADCTVTTGVFADGTPADGFPLFKGINPIGFKQITAITPTVTVWNITG